MKCENCGTENESDSRFCKNCGCEMVRPIQQETENINELIDKINQEMPIYKQVYYYWTTISELQKQDNSQKNKYMKFWQVVLLLFASMFFDMFASGIYIAARPGEFTSSMLLGFFLLPIIVFFAVRVLIKCIISASYKKKINILQAEYDSYKDKVKKMNLQYALPHEYRHYTAADFIVKALKNGRAESLKEAINLFEDQVHKWNMEGYQNQIYNATIVQNEILSHIR